VHHYIHSINFQYYLYFEQSFPLFSFALHTNNGECEFEQVLFLVCGFSAAVSFAFQTIFNIS